jgi:histidinol dehydrogenase
LKPMRVSGREVESLAREVRAAFQSGQEVSEVVRRIIAEVRAKGDRALVEMARELDGVEMDVDGLVSGRREMEEAASKADTRLLESLRRLSARIRRLEARRLKDLAFRLRYPEGTVIESVWRPISSVGCYAPGGRAPYVSTLLMLGVPATVAGVGRKVLATPPPKSEEARESVLAAAWVAGFDEVLWSGGAQAIAALAYGTERVRPVEKVLGPGNKYVAEAKRQVQADVAIDMVAGPTELVALFDRRSEISLVAEDMMAQAEHGPGTIVMALTAEERAAEELASILSSALNSLPEGGAVRQNLSRDWTVVLVENWEEAVKLVDAIAPEHLSIASNGLRHLAKKVRNAGAITVGRSVPSVLLDYFAGASHVLPTGGWARTRGGLTVLDYVKLIHVVRAGPTIRSRASREVGLLAEVEGLAHHRRALGP